MSRRKHFPESHIINTLMTYKLVWLRWTDIGHVLFAFEFMNLDSLSVHNYTGSRTFQHFKVSYIACLFSCLLPSFLTISLYWLWINSSCPLQNSWETISNSFVYIFSLCIELVWFLRFCFPFQHRKEVRYLRDRVLLGGLAPKLAQNSFQHFPILRFWWVSITTIYQLV